MVVLTRTGDADADAPGRRDRRRLPGPQLRQRRPATPPCSATSPPPPPRRHRPPDPPRRGRSPRVAPASAPGLVATSGRLASSTSRPRRPARRPRLPPAGRRSSAQRRPGRPGVGAVRPRCYDAGAAGAAGDNGIAEPLAVIVVDLKCGAATSRSPLATVWPGRRCGWAGTSRDLRRPLRRRPGPPPAPTSSRPTGASSPCRVAAPGGATSPSGRPGRRSSCSAARRGRHPRLADGP